jgi:translation elongation factor EF-1alpha
MDRTTPKNYDEVRFNEIKNEATNFLKKVGFKEENM